MTKYEALSDKEFSELAAKVEAEKAKRAAVEESKRKRALQNKNKLLFENRHLFLSLMRHGRTSCSDEDPSNGDLSRGYPRCEKCCLMNLTEWDLDTVEINFEISVRPA